ELIFYRSTQNQQKSHYILLELAPALEAEKQRRSKFSAALSVVDDNSEEIEGCTIPTFDDHANVELPEFIKLCFNFTVQEFKDLFIMTPGTTNITCHKITTNGPPLAHNNAEFQWTEECNNAFESIQKRLTEAPVLAFPRFDRQAGLAIENVRQAQQNDAMIQKLRSALEISQCPQAKQEWRKQLLRRNNCYLLVVQDYFSKWPEPIPIPDRQQELQRKWINCFACMESQTIVHSDQGWNFVSTIFRQTLEAFGIKKSHTTAYHPEGDGMVERLNRSLLQLLRTYAQRQDDWEKHLPLYQETLQAKLAELQDLVEAHIVESAKRHKCGCPFQLDPRWEGKWKVKIMKSPVTMEITDVEEDVNSGVQHTQRVAPLHNVQLEAPLVEDFDFGSPPPVANLPTLPPQPVQPEPPPPLPTHSLHRSSQAQ
ncbi:hypothetical protein EMCRGX_G017750, partial [Ephydatia muelleri]